MRYPSIATYEDLYARYLDRPVSELVDFAGDVKGKVVWDLCCGGGRLAGECLRRGASFVLAVDGSPEMTYNLRHAFTAKPDKRFRLEVADVRNYISLSMAETPDFVFCRQAVNYWLDEMSAGDLAERMPKGSVFAFNTFTNCPSEMPTTKKYTFKGHEFVEVSWLVLPNTVHHVQIRDGLEPHVTTFRWIPPSEFIRILEPHFSLTGHGRDKTGLWRCERK